MSRDYRFPTHVLRGRVRSSRHGPDKTVYSNSGFGHFSAEAVTQVPFDEFSAGIPRQGVVQKPDVTGRLVLCHYCLAMIPKRLL